MVDEQKHKEIMMENMGKAEDWTPKKENTEQSPLNLCKFVKLIDFNKRFTYQGSLTTAPLVEGILWNLVDTVIPIRQSTMDKYIEYRKVQEEISTNYMIGAKGKADLDKFGAARAKFPENHKCQYHEGSQFMKVAMCNRQVQDTNDRPVYHISKRS